MKLKVTKLLFMLLTLGVIPALCSCGSDDKEEEREENSVTSSISHESPTNLSAMMSYVGHKIDDISKVLGDWGYDVMPFGYYEWKDRNGNALGTVEYYQVGKSSADYYCFLFINSDRTVFYVQTSTTYESNYTQFLKTVLEEQDMFKDRTETKYLAYLFNSQTGHEKLYSTKNNFIEDLKLGYYNRKEDYCWERCLYGEVLLYVQKTENLKEYSDLKYAPSWFGTVYEQGWDIALGKKSSIMSDTRRNK